MLANVFFFFSFLFHILSVAALASAVSTGKCTITCAKTLLSTLVQLWFSFWHDTEWNQSWYCRFFLSQRFLFGNSGMFTIYFPQVCSVFWLPTSPGCTFAHAQASLRCISPQWSRLVPANWRRGIGPGNSAVIFCCDEKIKSKFTRNECGLLLVLGSILISEDQYLHIWYQGQYLSIDLGSTSLLLMKNFCLTDNSSWSANILSCQIEENSGQKDIFSPSISNKLNSKIITKLFYKVDIQISGTFMRKVNCYCCYKLYILANDSQPLSRSPAHLWCHTCACWTTFVFTQQECCCTQFLCGNAYFLSTTQKYIYMILTATWTLQFMSSTGGVKMLRWTPGSAFRVPEASTAILKQNVTFVLVLWDQ